LNASFRSERCNAMGAACSGCDCGEAITESDAEIKDQAIRNWNAEFNGDEGYKDKSPESGERVAVLLGSTTPHDHGMEKPPCDHAMLKSPRDHGMLKPSVSTPRGHHLDVILENKPQQPIDHTAPGTPVHAPSLARGDDMVSNSPACGTPRLQAFPSLSSIQSAASGQETARSWLQGLAARFPASSYAVSDAPMKMPSRHIAFAPSPTHSVHQSEFSVLPYSEVYGDHPMSFEFDAAGNKIPIPFDERDRCGTSPRRCLETVRGPEPFRNIHEPMGPAGAFRYK